MDASDKEFIQGLFQQQDERLQKQFEKIDERFEQIDKRFEQVDKRFEQMEERVQSQFAEMQHSIDLMVEDFDRKFDIVIEGQQILAEKIDRVEVELKEEIRKVDRRVAKVEADLAAHINDPNAHRGAFFVKEP